jgi:hypothetical protein
MDAPGPAQRITAALAIHLGPNTAQVAVRAFAARALGVSPEELRSDQVPVLLQALRPMLRTLLGPRASEETLEGLQRELR